MVNISVVVITTGTSHNLLHRIHFSANQSSPLKTGFPHLILFIFYLKAIWKWKIIIDWSAEIIGSA